MERLAQPTGIAHPPMMPWGGASVDPFSARHVGGPATAPRTRGPGADVRGSR
jgi:hypothetical protein